MAFTPAPPFPKTQGDIIRSSDWNDLVVETQRLDNDKVNKAGDAMAGPLTIDGNVGIGTTNPGAKLEIESTSGEANLHIHANSANGTPLVRFYKQGDLKWGWLGEFPNTGKMSFHSYKLKKDVMVLQDNGNVGIGTAAPGEKLEVNGRVNSGKLTIGPWPSNSNRYVFFGANTLDQANAGNYALLQDTTAGGTTFLNSQQNIRFRINNTDRMILANNGFVGIRTTNPQVALDVNGDFRVREASSVGNIHLFLASQYRTLWSNKGGGDYTNDVSSFVPTWAKGAVLKVIVNAGSVGTGSFVCADRTGKFSSISHYYQNGFTNYLNNWVGGMVLCPFFSGKKFKWRMSSNALQRDSRVKSYAALIGWF